MKFTLLILALFLTGCRTAQTSVEVQAAVGAGEPSIQVVAKVSVP